MRKYFSYVLSLHLYLGLSISPFVLVFSLGALVLNHQDFINRVDTIEISPTINKKLKNVNYERPDLELAQTILSELGIVGEINFVSRNKNIFSFPVNKPGLQTFIKVNLNNDSVVVSKKNEGFLRSMSYLHSMPGPHNIKIRGNSGFIKIWRIFSDIIVYMLLFLTFSGVFLWYFIKVERGAGTYALILGILFFSGILFVIF